MPVGHSKLSVRLYDIFIYIYFFNLLLIPNNNTIFSLMKKKKASEDLTRAGAGYNSEKRKREKKSPTICRPHSQIKIEMDQV